MIEINLHIDKKLYDTLQENAKYYRMTVEEFIEDLLDREYGR